MKILFLDFDGVMIPAKAYWLPGQTRPVTVFDPVAVSLVNRLCQKLDMRIVIISSWRHVSGSFAPSNLRQHLIDNGIKEECIHEHSEAPFKFSSSKYHDVTLWLEDHKDIEDYVIIDDDLSNNSSHKGHVYTPDFSEGLTFKIYREIGERFGMKDKIIL